jgi:hypothetical protein
MISFLAWTGKTTNQVSTRRQRSIHRWTTQWRSALPTILVHALHYPTILVHAVSGRNGALHYPTFWCMRCCCKRPLRSARGLLSQESAAMACPGMLEGSSSRIRMHRRYSSSVCIISMHHQHASSVCT